MDSKAILDLARTTIATESRAIKNLSTLLTGDFAEAVQCILKCEGRVVISGIGKSAIIASKIVATLNSTGTPAIFMHAADAIHGDLGMVRPEDVFLAISNSGETDEVNVILPILKRLGVRIIAMMRNRAENSPVGCRSARVTASMRPGTKAA